MACDVDEITYATGAPFKIMVESHSQSLGQGQQCIKVRFENISSDDCFLIAAQLQLADFGLVKRSTSLRVS